MNKNQKDGNFEENLGSRVKKLRQEMNLTQAEVADALDNEVMHLVAQMNDLEKQKLINTLRIWI